MAKNTAAKKVTDDVEQIEGLTPDQQAQIPVWREKYKKIALSTGDCDRPAAEAAVTALYKYQGLTTNIKFVWFDSPFAALPVAARIMKLSADKHPQKSAEECMVNYLTMSQPTKEELRDAAGKACAGAPEAYWVAYYDYIAKVLPTKHDGLIDLVNDMITTCGTHWSFLTADKKEGLVLMCERPTEIHLKDDMLHNDSGYAIAFKDGTGVCALNNERHESLLEVAMHDMATKGNGNLTANAKGLLKA
jgi:hypothetical protein